MQSRVQSFELKFSGVTVLQGVEFLILLLILALAFSDSLVINGAL